MNEVESAQKILEAFTKQKRFICLSDLAKTTGFLRASDRDFKKGFNYLVDKGILKLRQSSYRTSPRGITRRPKKNIVLNVNLYEVESGIELDIPEKLEGLPEELVKSIHEIDPFCGELETEAIKHRFEKFLDEQVKTCPKCQNSPTIFFIDKRDQQKIPFCSEHWNKLNDNIPDFEV